MDFLVVCREELHHMGRVCSSKKRVRGICMCWERVWFVGLVGGHIGFSLTGVSIVRSAKVNHF